MMTIETIWTFSGEKSNFPAGVFTTRELAEKWIDHYQLSGALTSYPVNTGVYDYAVKTGTYKPVKDVAVTPAFIQNFSDARQEHYFYKHGVPETAIDLTSYPLGDFFVEVCHLGRSPTTGKWQVSVEIASRSGTVLASSGKIEADAITNDLLAKMLPQPFSAEELSAIVEASWKDKFVL